MRFLNVVKRIIPNILERKAQKKLKLQKDYIEEVLDVIKFYGYDIAYKEYDYSDDVKLF